ncbi:nucleoside hydrolase [bacterium]|nr:nucleoside hydrolase [bacterium]
MRTCVGTFFVTLILTTAGLSAPPIPVIFDTDMGNDIDDALALAVIHALESRGECRLLAVTITKDHPDATRFIAAINNFYGRGDVPLGMVQRGKTPEPSNYLRGIVDAKDVHGQPLYPTRLKSSDAIPSAVTTLRKSLAEQADGAVVIIQVGFSTNLIALLDSPADHLSNLPGKDLVAKKVRLLSVMAGNFAATERTKEYNVFIDAPAARKLFAHWPTSILASGFEIGRVIKYPASSIEHDFSYIPHHPVAEAYRLYDKMPYDRETWDLTSVLAAVRPDQGYFGLSDPGEISVDDADITQFRYLSGGKHRYLTVSPDQIVRVRESLVQLTSQPPGRP